MPSNSIKEEGGWLYLLLAFCIAVFLWYTVNAREQIERLVVVRLDYKGLPQGLVVQEGQINNIEVRVRGPRELFRTMEGRDSSYTVDLSGLRPGLNVLPFNFGETSPEWRNTQVLEVSPARLTLVVDTLSEKVLPVTARLSSSFFKEGVSVQWLGVTPDIVTVRGPLSVIESMSDLIVETSHITISEDINQQIEVPVVVPHGVEVQPTVVTASYRVSIARESLLVRRALLLENPVRECVARPEEIVLRVSVPKIRAEDEDYLAQIMVRLHMPEDERNTDFLPIQVDLPEGVRLESIAPVMGYVDCGMQQREGATDAVSAPDPDSAVEAPADIGADSVPGGGSASE